MICRDRVRNRAFLQRHHGCNFTPAANGIKKVFESCAAPQDKQSQQQCNAGSYEYLLLS